MMTGKDLQRNSKPLDLEMLRSLLAPPPIIYPEKKLALLFSAKAGCTFAVKWFFYHMNLLDSANAYSEWVHDYRIKVYYRSPGYRENHLALFRGGYTIIKFVRNPFARAVSSFIHALKHIYEKKKIARFLGRGHNGRFSCSFREFLQYLSTIDLNTCNLHHRLQVHMQELRGVIQVEELVKLEESVRQIARIEEKYGLPRSKPSQFRRSVHHVPRQDMAVFCGDDRFPWSGEDRVFPAYENFYNEELAAMAVELYKKDFERYGYSTSQPLTINH